MSEKLNDLFKTFGEIYSNKALEDQFSLKKFEDKYSPTAIIVDAEKPLKEDEYYQKVLQTDPRSALAYKYGYVTQGLAIEISRLRHELDKQNTQHP